MVEKPQSKRPVGPLVRQFRKRAGLTQQELADLAGFSVASLRDLEQGRVTQPRANTLRRLAEALELPPQETDYLVHNPASNAPHYGLRVEVLGPLRLRIGNENIVPSSQIQQALLGALALSPNTPVRQDALVEFAWGLHPPENAVELLHTHISRLRRRLQTAVSNGDIHITTVQNGYQISVAQDHSDVLDFRALARQARHLRHRGELEAARTSYARAMKLWRGEPLAELPSLATNPLVSALIRERQNLIVEYASVAAELGKNEEVIARLQLEATEDPLHEAIHSALMIALASTGEQAAALKVFDGIRHRLTDELGTDPGAELREAHRRILRHEIHRPEFVPVSAHRQLPPDIGDFSGREAELRALHDRLPITTDGSTAVVISSIEGMGGVGKTRLAVHLAHQLLADGRYADHQLYVDLLGHSDQPPADPTEVLASFLRLLGVPGGQIPHSLDERSALYRDRLYGKNAMVLLDNAANENQVTPLLPASPANLVLITSRRTLALDGAHALPLDVFTAAEAENLLNQVVGPERVQADPTATRRVIDLCGRLPLAVALAARRLRSRSTWGFADLANRLEETGDRLSELAAGSRQLQAVLDLSYQALDGSEQQLFRLLGLHPGEDFTAASTAALTAMAPGKTRRMLDRLLDEHLLMMVPGDRYRLHDLLAEYARNLAMRQEDAETRAQATRRLLDYYLHTTARAAAKLQPGRLSLELAGNAPANERQMLTPQDADRWLEDERASLSAAVSVAAEQGFPQHAWQLAASLQGYLSLHGYIEDWERTHEKALSAAQASKDLVGESIIRTYLGGAYMFQNKGAQAIEQLSLSLDLHRETGNTSMQISALGWLSYTSQRLGRFAPALDYAQQAAILCRDKQDPYREGVMRDHAGLLLVTLGRFDEAIDSFEQAFVLFQRGEDRNGESHALADIGDAYRRLGQFEKAFEYLENALSTTVERKLVPHEAYARHRLGVARREVGELDEALAELTESLHIVRIHGALVTESEVLIDLAAVYRETHELGTALELLEESLALARKTGQRFQEARALDGLARVNHARGQVALSDTQWTQAHDIFVELDVPEAKRGPLAS